jgi:transcriptional regulator with XRE-family HTH domain
MEKRLNQAEMEAKCSALGMTQTSIAEHLGLSRAAVSKWFTGKSFPRPPELLKLGKLLGLRHGELVETVQSVEEPLVAFRKRAGCKTTDRHLMRARDMGHLLRPLVNYLDFDPFLGPPALKKPTTDYRYLQNLVAKVRREMDAPEDAPLDFDQLIKCFHEYQAVIIPTLWGKKSKHENALHIHLPDSKTTWIYLNLDVEIHDFKFWMAHELGHVMTSDLLETGAIDEAEDFAEGFAGALLYPESAAEAGFKAYKRQRTDQSRLAGIFAAAKEYTISPLSIYLELRNYANAHHESFTEIDSKRLHTEITNFNKRLPTLSEYLFDGEKPTANQFMRVAQEQFGTDFFKAFAQYIRDQEPGPSTISGIMGVSPIDARAYQDALSS